MKIAVTGGSGQLGTHVLRRLASDRKVTQVVSLDLRPPSVASAKVKHVHCDVRSPEIGRHFEGCDAVVHLAFLVTGHAPPAVFRGVNVEGSKNVFRAAAASNVRKVVYTSSIAAYGVVEGHTLPLTEASPRRRPTEFPYSECKYDVEEFLDGFESEYPNVAVARLRPGILVGAGMDHELGSLLKLDVLVGAPDARWPLVWDEDVADAALLCLAHDEGRGARGAFNVGAEDALPLGELAKRVGLRLVTPPKEVLEGAATLGLWLERAGLSKSADPAWVKQAHVPMLMSSEKARAVLGWRPRCATAESVLRRYVLEVPTRTDLRIRAFLTGVDLAGRTVPRDPKLDAPEGTFHLRVTGRHGGDFTVKSERHTLAVARGVPRPPDATVTLSDETFLDLLSGRLDFGAAQLTGRVRNDGVAGGAASLAAMLAATRARAGESTPAGWATRAMTRWFERDAAPVER